MYILLKSVKRNMEILGEFESIKDAVECMEKDVLNVIGPEIENCNKGYDFDIQTFEDSGYAWFNSQCKDGVYYDWKIEAISLLNSMNSFSKGFNIKRNGKIITMNQEEMSDFHYLDKAVSGKSRLENYQRMLGDENENKIIDVMKKDEEICYNIEADILDEISTHSYMIETKIIHDYILKQMKGQ